jgi:hypothetical protein
MRGGGRWQQPALFIAAPWGGGRVGGGRHTTGEGRGEGAVRARPAAARGRQARVVDVAWSCRTAGTRQGRGGG